MDELKTSARQMRIWSAFLTGCTYGIFLTIGTAWSEFVKEVITTILPENEDTLTQSLIYALSASFVSIVILVALVRCDACVDRVKSSTKTLHLKHIRRHSR
jgi:hypothetical protein